MKSIPENNFTGTKQRVGFFPTNSETKGNKKENRRRSIWNKKRWIEGCGCRNDYIH